MEKGSASDFKQARRFVNTVDWQLRHPYDEERFNFPWHGLVSIAVVLFAIYGNITGFQAGKDGCVYGPPTETQCGFEVIGTSKGKIFGYMLYGPGYLLGKALSDED